MIGKLATLALVVMFSVSGIACAAPRAAPPTGDQRPPRSEGQMCGGIAGFQCGKGLYCQFKESACRVMADASGVCRAKAEMCPMIYQPVCGCDGQTYPNACHAAQQGVSVAAPGECK